MSDIVKHIDIDPLCMIKSAAGGGEAEVLNVSSSGKYIPEAAKEYVEKNKAAWKSDDDNIYMLVVALSASDYYGPNTRNDYFPESALLEKQTAIEAQKYNPAGFKDKRVPRYKTFEWAKVYRWHRTDEDNRIGEVLKAFWDDKMKRVLCVIKIDKGRAPDVDRMIQDGARPAFSMGLLEPFDFCLCGNSPVFTDGGVRAISDIVPGDMVLGHDRMFHPVIDKQVSTPAEYIELSTDLMPPLKVTPNHMVFVYDGQKMVQRPACQLSPGERLVMPIVVGFGDKVDMESAILSSVFQRNASYDDKSHLVGTAIGKLLDTDCDVHGKWFTCKCDSQSEAYYIFNAMWSLGIPSTIVDSVNISVYMPGVVWAMTGNTDCVIEPGDIDGLDVFFDGSYIYPAITGIYRGEEDEAVEYFDLTVDGSHSFTSNYLVSNCSVCGNKRKKGESGCIHVQRYFGRTDPETGKPVYYINKVFFFNDLSVVGQNPADKTAWGLLKVASEDNVMPDDKRKPSDSQKEESIVKTDVKPIVGGEGIEDLSRAIQMLTSLEQPFDNGVLRRLSTFRPDHVFHGLLKSGMVLSPSEYAGYRSFGGLPITPGLASPQDSAFAGVLRALASYIDARSCAYDPMARRVSRIIITRKKPDVSSLVDAEKTASEYISYRDAVNDSISKDAGLSSLAPAAGFFAPYYLAGHYKRKSMYGQPLGPVQNAIASHPFILGLGGAVGTAKALEWLGGLAKNVKKFAADSDNLMYNLLEELIISAESI